MAVFVRGDAAEIIGGMGGKMSKRIDETGRTYGRLRVLEYAGTRSGKTMWRCRCSCGIDTLAPAWELRSGQRVSCGCAKRLDLRGRRFGRLTVTETAGRRDGKLLWACQCDCGRSAVIRSSCLSRGSTKSCGCLQAEARHKHGLTGSQVWRAWVNMRRRCSDMSNPDYGARGITVCEGFQDFENLLAEISHPPSPMHSVDRIDAWGNYSCGVCKECLTNEWPPNVRWADAFEQARNKRCHHV